MTPRSGAGRIKDDGISDTEVMEIKDANLSHTLQGAALDALFRRATQQGKAAVYIITFKAAKVTATIHITRS